MTSQKTSTSIFRDPILPGWTLTLLGLLSLFKGMRLPNLWSATQIQVDYGFGFIKRGAIGSLLNLLHVPVRNYWVFASLSFFILAAATTACFLFIRDRLDANEANRAYTALFASSFAVSFLAHLNGYFDIILLLVTVLLLRLPRHGWALAASYGFCVCGSLIHENFLVTFFPILWLPFAIDMAISQKPYQSPAMIHVVLMPLLALATTVYIASEPSLTVEQTQELWAAIAAKVHFRLRPDNFDVLSRTLKVNFGGQLGLFTTAKWWIDELKASLCLLWVALFFIIQSIRLVLNSSIMPHERRCILAAVIAIACFCPFFLQFLGWDLYRWYAITAFTSYMGYLLVSERFPDTRLAMPLGRMDVVLFCFIAVNLCSGAGLFDEKHINSFPFLEWLGRFKIPIH